MVVITFPDSETQKKAVGFLLGRFSGKVLKNGEHIVPEAALAALADKNISFTVLGNVEDVVHDASKSECLLSLAAKSEMMKFLREAKADADAGRTVPARDFLQSLGQRSKTRKTSVVASPSPKIPGGSRES